MKNKYGWDKKLGTSKKEQGIITPKPPRYKRLADGSLKCHCLFRGTELWQECYKHILLREQQKLMDEFIKKYRENDTALDTKMKEKEVQDASKGDTATKADESIQGNQ